MNQLPFAGKERVQILPSRFGEECARYADDEPVLVVGCGIFLGFCHRHLGFLFLRNESLFPKRRAHTLDFRFIDFIAEANASVSRDFERSHPVGKRRCAAVDGLHAERPADDFDHLLPLLFRDVVMNLHGAILL